MRKQHVVRLTPEERSTARAITTRSGASALAHRRARILLAADAAPGHPAQTDAQVAAMCQVSPRTVARVRERFATAGLAATLAGRPRPGRPAWVLQRESEERLIALASGPPPAGRSRWSLRLLADRAVEQHILPRPNPETVRRALKKGGSNHG
jgi:transposase